MDRPDRGHRVELLGVIDLQMATTQDLSTIARGAVSSEATASTRRAEILVRASWSITTILALATIAVQTWVHLNITNWRNDFTVFRRAGGQFLRGEQIYNLDSKILGWDFLYPPPALLVFAPFSLLPHWAAQWLFFVIGGSAMALALAYLWRAVPAVMGEHGPLAALAAIAMILATDAVWNNAASGQMSFLLTAICVGFLAALRSGRLGLAGFMAAFGILLKIYPAVMLAAVLFRRKLWPVVFWSSVVIAVAVAATLVVAPMRLFSEYFLGVLPKLSSQSTTAFYMDGGLSGFVFRWGAERHDWFTHGRVAMPIGLRYGLSITTIVVGMSLGAVVARAAPMTSLAAGSALIALPGITANPTAYVFVASGPIFLLALKLGWESRHLHSWPGALMPLLLVPLFLPAHTRIPLGHLLPAAVENMAYARYTFATLAASTLALYLAAHWDRRTHHHVLGSVRTDAPTGV